MVSLPEYCLPASNKYGRAEGGKHYEHAAYEMVRINRRTEEGLGMVAVARVDDWGRAPVPADRVPAGGQGEVHVVRRVT